MLLQPFPCLWMQDGASELWFWRVSWQWKTLIPIISQLTSFTFFKDINRYSQFFHTCQSIHSLITSSSFPWHWTEGNNLHLPWHCSLPLLSSDQTTLALWSQDIGVHPTEVSFGELIPLPSVSDTRWFSARLYAQYTGPSLHSIMFPLTLTPCVVNHSTHFHMLWTCPTGSPFPIYNVFITDKAEGGSWGVSFSFVSTYTVHTVYNHSYIQTQCFCSGIKFSSPVLGKEFNKQTM